MIMWMPWSRPRKSLRGLSRILFRKLEHGTPPATNASSSNSPPMSAVRSKTPTTEISKSWRSKKTMGPTPLSCLTKRKNVISKAETALGGNQRELASSWTMREWKGRSIGAMWSRGWLCHGWSLMWSCPGPKISGPLLRSKKMSTCRQKDFRECNLVKFVN